MNKILVLFWLLMVPILGVGVGFSSDDSPKMVGNETPTLTFTQDQETYEFNVSFKFNELPLERIIEIQKMLGGLAAESCEFTFKVTKKSDIPALIFSDSADGGIVYQNGVGYYISN